MGITVYPASSGSSRPSSPPIHLRPGPLSPTSEVEVSSKFAQASKTATVSFSVRIPRSQDLTKAFVGWTAPQYLPLSSEHSSKQQGLVEDTLEILRPGDSEDDGGEQWVVVDKIVTVFLVQLSTLLQEESLSQDIV